MAVQAYRTQPYSTTHENRIFDALLVKLEEVWGDSEDLVLLLGNFHCQGSEIDAAVLKKDSITVIDFKDYGGTVTFSENGHWFADDIKVKGGSKPNPYIQIRDNKYTLLEALNGVTFPSGTKPNLRHISGLVLFHKPITFNDRQIPPNIRWFHVVDFDCIIERLSQITSRGISLANRDLQHIVKTLSIPEYIPVGAGTKAVSLTTKIFNSDESDLPISLQPVISQIKSFLESSERILTVTGMVGTGLEQTMKLIASKAVDANRTYDVLAPNRRITSHYSIEANSIYNHIYLQNPKLVNEKFIYALGENKDPGKHLYIIGDAHLISDSKFETDDSRYGSGQILTDLLDFINLKKSDRQIIFLGDPFQLTRGKADESALCNERIHSATGFQVNQVLLDLILPENANNLFVSNCLELAECIKLKTFTQMNITTDDFKFIESPSESASKHELIRNLFLEESKSTKFITFSNVEANQLNSWLRRNVFQRDRSITVGDLVHIHNSFCTNNKDDIDRSIYVSNGSFAEVLEVNEDIKPLEQSLKGREQSIVVNFLKIKARLFQNSEEIVEFICLKDYLYAENPKVDTDTLIALHIDAKTRFNRDNIINKYHQMEVTNSEESGKPISTALANFLRNDPYLNAARMRFGYSLTLHRAQGQQFKTVLANMNIGIEKNSEPYFRWIYTLFSVVQERIILSNIPKITPFHKAVWSSTQSKLDSSVRPINLIAFNPNAEASNSDILTCSISDKSLKNLYLHIVNKIEAEKIQVRSYKHHNYQEIYDFEAIEDRAFCSLRLYYNGKYQVTRIESIKSEPHEFATKVQQLITSSVLLETEIQEQIYDLLKSKFSSYEISIQSIDHHNFQEIYYLKLESENLKLSIYYDGSGFISQVSPLGYTDPKIVEIVRLALEL